MHENVPPPRCGTAAWEAEHQASQASVEAYFRDVVGPYNPNAPTTVRVFINPNSGMVEQMPEEDPVLDDTGLFQRG